MDWWLLTKWRLRHLQVKCLFGIHEWEGFTIKGQRTLLFCENCPTDKDIVFFASKSPKGTRVLRITFKHASLLGIEREEK